MVDISQEIFEIANKPGRIGVLATASANGDPNVAYFGSPRLMDDGTVVMGLGKNHTLKNLEENPKAVFFVVAEGPVSFQTPGYRLYLEARTIEKEGPFQNNRHSQFDRDGVARDIGVLFEHSDCISLHG